MIRLFLFLVGTVSVAGAEPVLHSFTRFPLSAEYFSEGAGFGDVNGDGLPNIGSAGINGTHVLRHHAHKVTAAEFAKAQPKRFTPPPLAKGVLPKGKNGQALNLERPRFANAVQPPAPLVFEKPLLEGATAEDAAKAMTLPPGFRAIAAAAEPDVMQPIAFTLDHRGRMWVAEAYSYPHRQPEGKARDRILILEDTNGDHKFDKRKVFIDGLNLVSGLEVGFGGVWVGAAPYLLFIPDHDGDDKPDGKPQILLDGWGYQDTHETLNSFIWGPDGWLYGCHGVFTHSKVGKPGTPDAKRIPFNAGVWRYHPTRHIFEAFAQGTSNPWGVDFNEHGQCFIEACVIPHFFHMIQGGRYQRQGGRHFNPHTYDDIKTIADHLHYAGNIRDHAHWGKTPGVPSATAAAGGGHAHAGLMIYLGDSWPAQYRGAAFMNNIHGARLNMDLLKPNGSGYIASHGPDFVKFNDRWSQIINLRYDQDGSVYLIDWYDKNQCHRREPDNHDRSNGRIYKIIYNNEERTEVDLAKLTPPPWPSSKPTPTNGRPATRAAPFKSAWPTSQAAKNSPKPRRPDRIRPNGRQR